MPRSGRSTFGDYRSAMEGKGEKVIGARARTERRKQALFAIAGLCLIAAATAVYVLLRPGRTETTSRTSPVLVRCVDAQCGFEGFVSLRPRDMRFPVECPKCRLRSCQRVWECRECGYRFVPTGRSAELQCPECGSRQVGAAAPSEYVAPEQP